MFVWPWQAEYREPLREVRKPLRTRYTLEFSYYHIFVISTKTQLQFFALKCLVTTYYSAHFPFREPKSNAFVLWP